MKKTRVLVSWVADRDFSALYRDLDDLERKKYFSHDTKPSRTQGKSRRIFIKGEKRPLRPTEDNDDHGPVGSILDQELFDEVVVLCDRSPSVAKRYCAWAAEKWNVPEVGSEKVRIKTIEDYVSIYEETERVLEVVREKHPKGELVIHLTPGTRVMGSVLLLLGKSLSPPATFFHTYSGKTKKAEIPFDLDVVVDRRDSQQAELLLADLEDLGELEGLDALLGKTPEIMAVKRQIKRIAPFPVSCLIQGQTGTGKEIVTHLLHKLGKRSNKKLVAVNCSAFQENLLESEIFGHKKGSFTGAEKDRKGLIEEADKGVLFLDEVGECSPALQAKLLRVLQEGQIRRIGGNDMHEIDVQIIAATNRVLLGPESDVDFRPDLYYRLAQVTIHIPPLCERKNDIPLLVEQFLDDFNKSFAEKVDGYVARTLSNSAIQHLKTLPWHGNVRELMAILRRALIYAPADQNELNLRYIKSVLSQIQPLKTVPADNLVLGDGFSLPGTLQKLEARYIKEALEQSRGKKAAAARLLGIKPQTLGQKIKKSNS